MLLLCNGISQNFCITEKTRNIPFLKVNELKVQDFRFSNGTIPHVKVDGAVWSNPLIFLARLLFGITHLE